MSGIRYRNMSSGDLAAVMAVQAEAYGDGFIEGIDVIAARLEAAPKTAWVAEDGSGVCAYLVGYPSVAGRMTALGGPFRVAREPDCLYLHDLAVSPRSAGLRIGPSLVRNALAFAEGAQLKSSALVSVQASKAFWLRQGYCVAMPVAEESAKLESYPGDAVYMARRLGP
ncbi:GNAT family N-acetyltransferase [Parazoarcus communis]|nr:GNAT family N-acetyltransferase [Parazoarcus communis]